MEKINCIFFCFFDIEIIKKSLEFLINMDKFIITVIENSSENTEIQIKPYIMSLIKEGKVDQYFLFKDNISVNALEIALNTEHIKLQSKYTLLTDGDLICHGDWLEEQINILEKCPEVFICAVPLSMENLPLNNFPDAGNWCPKPTHETDLYLEIKTGVHLTLLRSVDVKPMAEYIKKYRIKFVESSIYQYAKLMGKKWAGTKKARALHLTWTSYQDLNHPYTKFKQSKAVSDHWFHDRYCDYTLYKKD